MNEMSINQPLVSICCITYNQEKYVRDALEGFLMQKTTFPFEIIIHDDASVDRTADIIQEYEKKYPALITAIYQSENQYSSGMRGIAARFTFPKARGKYIAICEGDDYWTDPYKLQKQVDFLEQNMDYSICFHKVRIQKGDLYLEDYITKVPSISSAINDLLIGNYLHTCSVIFRKPPGDFPPKYFYKLPIGDYPLWIYVARFGKIFYLNETMAIYRVHENGIWSEKIEWDFKDFRKRELLIAKTYFLLGINNTCVLNLKLLLRSIRVFLGSTRKYYFTLMKTKFLKNEK